MTDAELIARLRVDEPMCEEHFTANAAADRIEALIAERDAAERREKLAADKAVEYLDRAEAAEAKLAENEVRLGKAVEALSPLSAIADAYDENELDDEARKLWGKNLEHENRTPLDEIEIFAGRGGKRLLTLEDAMKARATLAEIKGESQ